MASASGLHLRRAPAVSRPRRPATAPRARPAPPQAPPAARCPADAERQANFNVTGLTATAFHAMVPELPEQLALKEWPEGISADEEGDGGIWDLLTTEEPPSAASVTPRGRRVADREVPRRRSGSTGSQRSYCGAVEGLGGPLAASWVLAG